MAAVAIENENNGKGDTTLAEEARTNWLEATRIHCKYGANVSNINVVAIETYRTCDLYLENNEDINTKCTDGGCRFSYPIPMDGFGGDNFIYIPPYTTVEYSCIPLDIAGESLREDATGSGSITILVIGASVGGLVVFVVIVLMICFVRRRKPKREKNVELTSNHRTSGLNSANTDTEENVYFNSGGDMHEDQTYENGQERPVDDSTDHIYQISAKHRKFQASNDERLNISTNKDHRHSTSSDHYADHVEGVYDIAHKAQYKDNDGEHAIYSHAVEDVYDTAEAHSRPEPRALEGDDLYDKFTSQT